MALKLFVLEMKAEIKSKRKQNDATIRNVTQHSSVSIHPQQHRLQYRVGLGLAFCLGLALKNFNIISQVLSIRYNKLPVKLKTKKNNEN